MKKYGGKLVYSCKDEFGPIEIVEFYNRMRSLHFGNKTQQTAMFLHDPIILIHKYTQAMLTPLCWQTPDNVLILGLGAGSIAKFLLHHYQYLELTAVDLRPEVVKLGQEYFSLNAEDERFKIHYQSADDFINKNVNPVHKYDLILIDLFLTRKDQDINVDISNFAERLPALLNPHGHVCINLIGNEPWRYSAIESIKIAFDNRLFITPVDNSNTILIAGKTTPPPLLNDDHNIDFTTLEKKLNLPFRQYISKMTRA